MKKLKNRLTITFIMFSLGIIFLISFASHVFMEKNFNEYLENSIVERKNALVKDISNTYKNGEWDKNAIEDIVVKAIDNGLILNITDEYGSVIWSARTQNSVMCDAMMEKMDSNMNTINPGFQGEYTVDTYELKADEVIKGILEIGHYGPFYYNDSDVGFFNTLNNILILVGIFSLGISIFIGMLISSSISKPILSVVKATNLIATGQYKSKIQEKSNVEEINEMINSVNKLATSLDEEEKIRRILTKDISHELRTPLTTIQGQVEALIDGIWEPSEKRLQSIHEEVLRLGRLVGSLEHLSRYESEDLVLDKINTNIDELIRMIIINFEKQLHDKRIKLELKLDTCKANIDKDKITQAVVNIISNSIKYTDAGGSLNVTCLETDSFAIISVKDNGRGISEEHIPYIFERFYRVDESRARATGGAGIGLTISKAIVEAHGGTISVESKIDEGTEFIIEIPK
ncbi:ATP-binding protein [Clostridium sp.]|uniref:sensor histidine kinase n=1 Tax=Clostridium sp. TaxID=1506 RepID=UPI003217A24F